jgi:hypothetical protein
MYANQNEGKYRTVSRRKRTQPKSFKKENSDRTYYLQNGKVQQRI